MKELVTVEQLERWNELLKASMDQMEEAKQHIDWVLKDMTYKAPEQVVGCVTTWFNKLQLASQLIGEKPGGKITKR